MTMVMFFMRHNNIVFFFMVPGGVTTELKRVIKKHILKIFLICNLKIILKAFIMQVVVPFLSCKPATG